MRRILAFFLALGLLFSTSIAIAGVDISEFSYEELVGLVNEAQMLMMKSDKCKRKSWDV